jgi:hypothetical protein
VIDVFVEMLKCKRDTDNKHMEGEFRMSSGSLNLTSTFSFQMDADNLTQINKITIRVKKNGEEYFEISDPEAFHPDETTVINEYQKIVLRALSEVLEYFWGVHDKVRGIPKATISGFLTQVPNEKAMEVLGAVL